MTIQMQDLFVYRGCEAHALAISKRFDFSPSRDFGIELWLSWSTANHRGFWCEYELGDEFLLRSLCLVSKDDAYPPLRGVQAEPVPIYLELFEKYIKQKSADQRYRGLPMQYPGLNYPIGYTGLILIGTGMETGSRRSYRQVLELSFEQGLLMETTDRTEMWEETQSETGESTIKPWWTEREHDYYYLINYGF